ncbi:hypothetical protein ACFFSW_15065 [Saccharothrix longispora]|uniref:Transcriptional regulator, AbiEi antitoxin, Type IV TA system n=1 Tax=Saccharothrix longispora TaxID=33920 RepID=A0ABU1PZB7_9PSEU|nr:hypothetical protein [Saccharothrix longispora]MDR6595980.1 hypothetical protein [Saccharothrix longispora]
MHTTTRTTIAVDALAALFPHGVATAADLLSLGLGSEELSRRCRPRGGWQHVLPGVLLLSDRPPTRPQLVQAALRHCGTGSIVTGLDALQLHGMRALPAHGPVHVLVTRPVDPSTRVRATRTRHPPDPVLRRGFLTAPLARAAADAARTLETRDDIRAVLTEALRRGGVAVDDLRPHLSRASAPAKRVLAELAEGVRSAPQAWARSLVAGLPLPPPRWGVRLRSAAGGSLGAADAWWEELALAWQFTTATAHSPALAAAGAVVVHTPPARLRQAPAEAARALLAAAARAADRKGDVRVVVARSPAGPTPSERG